MPQGSLVILMYHSIDESGSVISVSPAVFRRQMEHLSGEGFRVLTLSAVAEHLRRSEAFPQKSLALTFDDGFQSTYTLAFPILQQRGFSATVFLVSGYVGRRNDWPSQPPRIPRLPLLSWAQIDEMGRHGIHFGAHTMTHSVLPGVSPAEAEREIGDSKAVIEDHLQRPVEFFAYPYGRYDRRAREMAAGLFRGACSTHLGRVRSTSDPWALERIDVYYLSAGPLFGLLSSSLLDPYAGVVNLVRSARQRLRRPATAGY